jgi:hypothetical protein
LAATLVLAGGAAAANACSTSPVDNVPDSGSTSSTSNVTTGGNTSSASGTGTTNTTSATTSTTTVVCSQPPSPDGGFATIIDFTKVCAGDGGPNLGCFGTYPSFYGGTFSFAPTTDMSPDPDSGAGCNIFGTQSTFTATLDTTAKTWTLGGEIGGYSGGGLYIGPCVDASNYTGIEFTASGSITSTSDAAGSNQLQLQVSQLSDWNVASAGGSCLTPGETCSPFVFNFDIPSTPSDIKVPFSMLTGGAPVAIFDPMHIIQIQWQFPWTCQGGTPYMGTVTLSNVQFYK